MNYCSEKFFLNVVTVAQRSLTLRSVVPLQSLQSDEALTPHAVSVCIWAFLFVNLKPAVVRKDSDTTQPSSERQRIYLPDALSLNNW